MKKLHGFIVLIGIAIVLAILGIAVMSVMIIFSVIGFYIHFGAGLIVTFVNCMLILWAYNMLINIGEKKNNMK